MQGTVDLIPQTERSSGTAIWAVLSVVLHLALLALFIFTRKAPAPSNENAPMLRYVELMRQDSFTEAPGPQTEKKPSLTAPYSDANRIASTPRPNGTQPTAAPGSGGLYQPGSAPAAAQQQVAAAQPPSAATPREEAPGAQTAFPGQATTRTDSPMALPTGGSRAIPSIDWNSAISRAGESAPSSGGAPGMASSGGEEGFAESGPISFESQWYDWGPYSQSMVAKIRTHWYANMPSLIRSGMQGYVVIRFTIQRSGAITDITILQTSTVPPFDYAARKAIELASPLNALPRDFPSPTERVTAAFYYNMSPQDRENARNGTR